MVKIVMFLYCCPGLSPNLLLFYHTRSKTGKNHVFVCVLSVDGYLAMFKRQRGGKTGGKKKNTLCFNRVLFFPRQHTSTDLQNSVPPLWILPKGAETAVFVNQSLTYLCGC